MRDDILYKVLAGNVTCPSVIEQMAVSKISCCRFTSDPPRVQARSFAAQRRQYLAAAFHETFHHIGKTYSAYSDESLGRAAFALTGDSQLLPNDHDPLKWSSYWDNQLMKHCMPDLVRAGNVSK
jgi:hypothetical protein